MNPEMIVACLYNIDKHGSDSNIENKNEDFATIIDISKIIF